MTNQRHPDIPAIIDISNPISRYLEIVDQDGTILSKKYAISAWDDDKKLANIAGEIHAKMIGGWIRWDNIKEMHFPNAIIRFKDDRIHSESSCQ